MKATTVLVLTAMAAVLAYVLPLSAHAQGDSSPPIHACIDKKSGVVRIPLPSTPPCDIEGNNPREQTIDWNSLHTALTPLGSSTIYLSQTPGTNKAIAFEDDGNGTTSELQYVQPGWNPSLRQYFFTDRSRPILSIQSGFLDMHISGDADNGLALGWWEDSYPIGIVYHSDPDPDQELVLNGPTNTSLSLSTEDGGILDASSVPIRLQRRNDLTEPDIPRDTFALWSPSDTQAAFFVLDIGGAQFRAVITASAPGTPP